MKKGTVLIGGAGLGAGLMYLLDPERGKGRRALVRDQAIRSARKTREAAEATARDAQNRTRGMLYSMKSWVSPETDLTDDLLVERVRSKLGMLVRHPRSIEVTARDGTVILSGPVLADEVDSLMAMVSRVAGVSHVENRLDVHEEPGDVPGLQGGPSRRPRGDAFALLQSNWSPTARLVTGAGLAAMGLAFLGRGLLNREFADLLSLDQSRVMDRRRDPSGTAFRRGESAASRKRLKDVMTSGVEVIHPNATVAEAAGRMKALNVGAIPVCDGDRLVGMLTDRDIVVRMVAEQRDLKGTTVRDAMTPHVTYCFEDEDVQKAGRLMSEKQIRRLVVLNRGKRLVGIVSLGDLAVEADNTRSSGEVLERVSEPAEPRR
jgi:CBS domain-containing protein/osmotically-inducible protein OsmY